MDLFQGSKGTEKEIPIVKAPEEQVQNIPTAEATNSSNPRVEQVQVSQAPMVKASTAPVEKFQAPEEPLKDIPSTNKVQIKNRDSLVYLESILNNPDFTPFEDLIVEETTNSFGIRKRPTDYIVNSNNFYFRAINSVEKSYIEYIHKDLIKNSTTSFLNYFKVYTYECIKSYRKNTIEDFNSVNSVMAIYGFNDDYNSVVQRIEVQGIYLDEFITSTYNINIPTLQAV